jgi:hypothetical protein
LYHSLRAVDGDYHRFIGMVAAAVDNIRYSGGGRVTPTAANCEVKRISRQNN